MVFGLVADSPVQLEAVGGVPRVYTLRRENNYLSNLPYFSACTRAWLAGDMKSRKALFHTLFLPKEARCVPQTSYR